jgi:hypothetical protein
LNLKFPNYLMYRPFLNYLMYHPNHLDPMFLMNRLFRLNH